MSKSNGNLVPYGERGIREMNPETAGSIKLIDWHAVHNAIDSVSESLNYRGPEDLTAALEQIENYLREASGEIGQCKDSLDNLPPVGSLTKFFATVFSFMLPALQNIVKRAELRDDAHRRLEMLSKANNGLIELRRKVADRIDELVEQRFSEDGQNEKYEKCRSLRNKITEQQATLTNVIDALNNEIFSKDEVIIWTQSSSSTNSPHKNLNVIKALQDICRRAGSTLQLNPKYGVYGNTHIKKYDVRDISYSTTYVELTSLKSELNRLKIIIEGSIQLLQSRREAILNKKKMELLKLAEMTTSAELFGFEEEK